MMSSVAAFLFWASDNERLFAIACVTYVIVLVVVWRLAIQRANLAFRASRAFAGSELFELEKLNLLEVYLDGRWQLYRYGFMLIMSLLLTVVSFIAPVRDAIAGGIHLVDSTFSKAEASLFLPIMIFVFIVFVCESWVWSMRLKARYAVGVIDDLRERYRLSPAELV